MITSYEPRLAGLVARFQRVVVESALLGKRVRLNDFPDDEFTVLRFTDDGRVEVNHRGTLREVSVEVLFMLRSCRAIEVIGDSTCPDDRQRQRTESTDVC